MPYWQSLPELAALVRRRSQARVPLHQPRAGRPPGTKRTNSSDPMTSPPQDGRADVTRRQILRAASHQFARRAYHDVGLDDILAEADLHKGAMYFHFRSKHALAVAIIERQATSGTRAGDTLPTRKLCGVRTLIHS